MVAATNVHVTEDGLVLDLEDGRTISAPLARLIILKEILDNPARIFKNGV